MKYEELINSECNIKPLELKGHIVGIYIAEKGVQYQVRYYWNGEQKNEYFFDWEVEFLIENIERILNGNSEVS